MLAVSERCLHLTFEMSRASDSSTRTIRRNRIAKATRSYMDLPIERRKIMPIQIWESEALVRREILRSLTKKQESFATVPAHRMKALGTKAFAFIMAMRTAMPYDGIGKYGGQAPPVGAKN
jgi:hypothetical protein